MYTESESRTPSPIIIATVLLVVVLGAAGGLKWKMGSDRAGCQMNQRNIQQAMRAHQGMNNLMEGSPLDRATLVREYFDGREPQCPCGGSYTWSPTVPGIGTLAAPCPRRNHEFDPGMIADW